MSNRSATNLDPTSSNASSHGSLYTYRGTPNTPVQVLNPNENCYLKFKTARDKSILSPNFDSKKEPIGRYGTISSSYCSECKPDTNYYTVRTGRSMAPAST